jgi:translation initiation factor eIF-2B subunit epsilon
VNVLQDYEFHHDYSDIEHETDAETESSFSDSELDEIEWTKEVAQTIERAIKDDHAVEIAVLELNTLKMAQNITFQDLRSIVFPRILELIPVNANRSTIQKVSI